VPAEPTNPSEPPPVPLKAKDKPALIKSPARDAHKEISGDTIAQLKKNLAEDPTSGSRRARVGTRLNLRAGLLLLRGEVEEAFNTCKEALAQKPSDVPTLTNLAAIQFEKGAYRDAEETLRRVESLGGGRSQTVNYLLGEAYYAQDKIQ